MDGEQGGDAAQLAAAEAARIEGERQAEAARLANERKAPTPPEDQDLQDKVAEITRTARLNAAFGQKPLTLRVHARRTFQTDSGAMVQQGKSVDLPTDEAMLRRELEEVRMDDADLESLAAETIAARRAAAGSEAD